MTLVVYALGGVLVLAGGIFVLMGIPVVHLEQGWTEIIAGSVVGTAGLVIVVLGMFLYRLEALQLSLEALASAGLPGAALPVTAGLPATVGLPVALPIVPDQPSVTPEPAGEPARDPDETIEALDRFVAAEPLAMGRPKGVAAPHEVARDEVAQTAEEEVEEHVPGLPDLQPVATIRVPPNEPVDPTVEPSMRSSTNEPRRPNFLASFLLKRMGQPAAEKPDRVVTEAAVEPILTPLAEVSPPSSPGRTSIDLSSGWAETEPAATERKPEWLDLHPVKEPPPEVLPEPELDARQDVAEDEAFEAPALDEPASAHHEETLDPLEAEEAEQPEPALPQPTIVGRYTAGSASYVMYSNGMIEVETETGIHQFGSMQELKSFIEQQDRAQV